MILTSVNELIILIFGNVRKQPGTLHSKIKIYTQFYTLKYVHTHTVLVIMPPQTHNARLACNKHVPLEACSMGLSQCALMYTSTGYMYSKGILASHPPY